MGASCPGGCSLTLSPGCFLSRTEWSGAEAVSSAGEFLLTTHGFLVACGLVAAIVNSRCLAWTKDSLKYSQINPGLGEK